MDALVEEGVEPEREDAQRVGLAAPVAAARIWAVRSSSTASNAARKRSVFEAKW